MQISRKTPEQLEALEHFYSEEKYPAQSSLEEYAGTLGLTYRQVCGWFAERRRREKREKEMIVSSHKTSSSLNKCKNVVTENCLQDLLTPGYILEKVFRKDGPPLGVEFDNLPSRAFPHRRCLGNSYSPCHENERTTKRRKCMSTSLVSNEKSGPSKKHGIGKGLMTAWQAINPDRRGLPADVNFCGRDSDAALVSTSSSQKQLVKRKRQQQQVNFSGRRGNRSQDRRKQSFKRAEVASNKQRNQKKLHKVHCGLALEGVISKECQDHFRMLEDDEELELRDLQAGSSPVTCCNHFSSSGFYSCSLCKDFLAKFPTDSVKMKQPFGVQPWDSSPVIVKKLFKVFHFLYTYAMVVDICTFTLDEFAQAFHDKDSMLLGKIHVALLKLLLHDVDAEIKSGFLPHLSKSCKFLALIHSLENQESVLEVWNRSLNSLTWTEILRQVLVASGFGSKQGPVQRESLSKEAKLMAKFSLRSGTLKGELFRILSERGNDGMGISDLARMPQIAELNLACTNEELELQICSTLSRDITLFEKISASAYRLRMNLVTLETDESESDSDSGSVDDVPNYLYLCDSDDSGSDSGNSIQCLSNGQKTKSTKITMSTEIDVSHPGEVWLLGLMEGEYSDLSIEEKLDALVALIDLLSDGSSARIEIPITAVMPTSCHHGSGAKIKRSIVKQPHTVRPFGIYSGDMHSAEGHSSLENCPVDSSAVISKFFGKEIPVRKEQEVNEMVDVIDMHPMQSLFLGSDRRYNRYWLFLGPCSASDPGHRRVYFESSEDGHWEVIDTEEAVCTLLSVLDDRGKREAFLIESLERRQASLCEAMSSGIVSSPEIRFLTQSDQSELDTVREGSHSPMSDVDNLNLSGITSNSLPSCGAIVLDVGKKREEQKKKWSLLQAFGSWIWNSCYMNLNAVKHGTRSYLDSLARCESCHDLYWRDEKHCKICHSTFELDFDLDEKYAIHMATCREKEDTDVFPKHKVLSPQLQSLKAAVHAIESVMPQDALVGAWTKSAHKLWVKRLRRTTSLGEILQVLADFVGAINEDWLFQCNSAQSSSDVEEIITSFSSLPKTSSAVALWLVKLDALIAPCVQKISSEKRREIFSKGKRITRQ